jgi:hypothetical protein
MLFPGSSDTSYPSLVLCTTEDREVMAGAVAAVLRSDLEDSRKAPRMKKRRKGNGDADSTGEL